MWVEGVYRGIGVSRQVALLAAVILVLMPVVTGQARGATLGSAIVSDPEFPDYCGHSYELRYEGVTGERNDAQFNFVESVDAPALTIGPICWKATPDESVVSDLNARVLDRSDICVNYGRQVAHCISNIIVGLVVNTYDQRDLVKVGPANPPAIVSAGAGDDAVNAANGSGHDRISCGAGNDGATGDPGDEIAADCEKITRLGPS